jgi:hypothetical protein
MTTPPQTTREKNALAVVSLVFGFMSYYFVVIPFGVIIIPVALLALRQIKERGEGGRNYAIAALALSGVHTVVYFAIFVGLVTANI